MARTLRDPECVFCQPNDRTVWEGHGLAICSDPAPLAPGHLLIYTQEHHPSAADVGSELAARVDDLERVVGELVCDEYGDYIVFEHGRTGHCLRSRPGERMCHHVHVHIIPGRLDIGSLVLLGQRTRVESWVDVVEQGSDTDGYVVVGRGKDGKSFYPVAQPLPPHYLRSVIAEASEIPEMADWEAVVSSAGAGTRDAAPESHALVEALVARMPIEVS